MLKILIVEDDVSLGGGVSMALKAPEIDVVWCQNILDARARMAKEQFSLFVLDINLPDGSGLDLLREIKEKTQDWWQCQVISLSFIHMSWEGAVILMTQMTTTEMAS